LLSLFGVLIRLSRASGPMVIVAGLIWGVLVFAFSTWIGLPIAATVFGAGEVSMPV
jgi:hypothetical protein